METSNDTKVKAILEGGDGDQCHRSQTLPVVPEAKVVIMTGDRHGEVDDALKVGDVFFLGIKTLHDPEKTTLGGVERVKIKKHHCQTARSLVLIYGSVPIRHV